MKIVIVHPDPQIALAWQRLMREQLPQADVFLDASSRPGGGDPSAADTANPTGPIGSSRSAGSAGSADYAIGWAPPADFFAREPRLRAFVSAAAGVDHVLHHPGLAADLPLLRLEDAGMAEQMVDYCRHELLHVAGRHHDYALQQRERRWQERQAEPRAALPVGVLGLGVLGGEVATRLAADGWTVSGHARTPRHLPGVATFSGAEGWPAFLAATRVLILMAPLTPQTTDLIDAAALAGLRPDGWLINVARGALVVEADLLAALDSGRLAGATLDVFRREPLPPDSPLWAHPRVRITPHVSAVTRIDEAAVQVAARLRQLARGERPGGLVDRQRGY